MSIQPPWNEVEAAVLLEAVLNVENGKEQRKEAISRVSTTLRKMAITQGIEIDEKYRNVNGITFQFQSMEYSAFDRETPAHKTGSRLFAEIVRIYYQDPKKYARLLSQATEILTTPETSRGDIETIMNNKDAFKEWLLSIGKKENVVTYLVNEFDAISEYAKEKKVSTAEMWEITNPKQYAKYVHALQEYKFFRVLQKDRNRFLQNNSKIYLSFLKDNSHVTEKRVTIAQIGENEYAQTDIDKRLCSSYPEDMRKIYAVLNTDSRHAFLSVKQVADLANCEEAVASVILTEATWSEMLGNGFVIGVNARYRTKTQLQFSIEQFYGPDSKVEEILKSDFRRGFRPQSIMDRKRFVNIYEERFGETILEREATDSIVKSTFAFDDRLFLPKAVVDRGIAEAICSYMETFFSEKEVLFNDVLFNVFREQFNSLVYSPEMLAMYVKSTVTGTPLFFSDKYFSYNPSAKPDILSEVVDFLVRMDRPCSYDEIYSAMPHLKKEDIYYALHYNTSDILGNSKTEYFHIDVAHVSEREKESLESYCNSLLGNSRYITCNEIIENLSRVDANLAERCSEKFSTLGLRRILTYFLRARFDVMTGVITRKGEQMAPKDVFSDFAQKHQRFSVDDIQNLSEYTGTIPYWDSVYANAVRVSRTEFVSDLLIDFDSEAIDEAIAYYCDDYIPLAGIVEFMRFPSCGYPWNTFLLQGYVHRFSKAFKLMCLGFAKGNASGVIVKRQCAYPDFDSVIVDALTKTEITQKTDALDFLCERGFISDRRYKKVEELLKKAIVHRRNNKEK